MKPKRLSRKTIHESPWVSLYVDRVELPTGEIVEDQHVLEFDRDSVAALVENERKELLLVRAYRYPTDSLEWEIPAGYVEKGESVVEAARREALEESGFETSEHEEIYSYYPLNGMTNKVFHVVRCRALGGHGVFDKSEIEEVKWFSREEVQRLIQEKAIKDGFSLTALLLYLQEIR